MKTKPKAHGAGQFPEKSAPGAKKNETRGRLTHTEVERRVISAMEERCGKFGPKTERTNLGLELLSIAALPKASFTYSEIAAWCGCSPEAIRIMEWKALRRLREAMKRMGFRGDEI